jgi:TolA-binding protein
MPLRQIGSALFVKRYPETEAAPEAVYWAGVARYKATGDASALSETARQFRERYQSSSWAKKASVWDQSTASAASAPR